MYCLYQSANEKYLNFYYINFLVYKLVITKGNLAVLLTDDTNMLVKGLSITSFTSFTFL